MRRLAERQEQPYLLLVDGQALPEGADAGRQQRGRARRPQREADIGGADHLLGQSAHGGTRLAADHHPADLAHHLAEPAERAEPSGEGRHRGTHLRREFLGEFLGILGQHPAHGLDRPGRDGVAQLRPDRQGRLDPLRPAPRLRDADPGGQGGGVLQPEVGRPDRLHRLAPVDLQDARIPLGGDGLPRHVLGEIPVDRPALPGHQVGELAQGVGELLRVAQRSQRSRRPSRAARTPAAAAGAARHVRRASRITRVPVTVARQAEAKGRIGHLRCLSGRMEGSTSATLSGSTPW